VTFFMLTSDDVAWLNANVRVENRLGAGVQLCGLPWLGWIPDDLTGCPSAAVDRLRRLLGLAAHDARGLLAGYGGWEGRTRRDHRALVLAPDSVGEPPLPATVSSSTRSCSLGLWSTTRPQFLLQLACDWLRDERIDRPSVYTLSRRVAAGRAQ